MNCPCCDYKFSTDDLVTRDMYQDEFQDRISCPECLKTFMARCEFVPQFSSCTLEEFEEYEDVYTANLFRY